MKSQNSFIIHGLAGKRILKGKVHINGAKNAALKAMAAAVLFDGPVILENIPDTADVTTMRDVLEKLGAKVKKSKSDKTKIGMTLEIDSTGINSTAIDADLAKNMRSSVVLTGPLLARYGSAIFPAPGGCVIGARPIDLFLSAYEKLGATIVEQDCVYKINSHELSGAEITFNKISVGATETLMMAAVLLKGTTVLKNCAKEPEIGNVAEWLNNCGANISGIGTPTLTIQGTNGKLLQAKTTFMTIPDRIEAGSYLILAALCGEDVTIEGCRPDHMVELIDVLKESGVMMEIQNPGFKIQESIPQKLGGERSESGDFQNYYSTTNIRITNNTVSSNLFKAFNIRTSEYPGIATDIQAPLATFMTQAQGESRITETIFEGRFKYIEDLIVLGANITMTSPQEIVVSGPVTLTQSTDDIELTAHDIRAGFAVVLAALIAKGNFIINNVHLIDRGYEKLEERLRELGADIHRK